MVRLEPSKIPVTREKFLDTRLEIPCSVAQGMRLDDAPGGSLLVSPRNHRSAPRLSRPEISDLKLATCSDAKPTDPPLVQRTNFEFVINVRAAKAFLHLIPPSGTF
jgi:hypothetical protein